MFGPSGVHSRNRRPPACAAAMSCSRSATSPLGSTTTAPMPAAIAATAIRVWVTVLPDPVAPTTSVWVPPVSPPKGTVTLRQRSSWPSSSSRPAPPPAPDPPPARARSQAASVSGVRPPGRAQAIPIPSSRSMRCRRRRRQTADSPASAIGSARSPSGPRASTASADAEAAQLQCKPCLRIRRAARRPTATARMDSPAIVVRRPSASSICSGGVCTARRTGTSEGMSPSFRAASIRRWPMGPVADRPV